MKSVKLSLTYLVLTLGALTMLLPFVWMLVTSLQPAATTFTGPQLRLPPAWQWLNYPRAWHAAPFARYCLNSLVVTLTTTVGQLVTSILAAFAFTHLRFYGRRILFNGLIALMMVPGELLLIPNFITMTRLHWVDTYAALIIPWLASIFAMFTLRQAFNTASATTYYAARLDGASNWQYLWQILVPANRPTITAVAVLQIIGSWNAFMWPLIITNFPRLRTLPVGLVTFTSETGTDYPLLMAATVFVIFPLLILYLFLQKYLIAGITRANLKG
ncbi:carbohydrate ABC transporter permease [Levilactobacillus acidifarinae]|uniref:Sugar ABC transporterpermease n=1 Tax=Levilactobacillus acidifarinae DSM 19394 = JCM 15949 TaxID=1423715 RepID=A0A0R1LU08_9LACO|nr:carbohydrate ABC transporter permease [Levilactobacillus acidifarinae]KRK96329.1 sugar ABC transporterpermease [Levilactobacillus acidifarinae DSM 19394]GEO69088.1 sugar ABC transporter permease [Levilactobacillus acidifarinae]